MTRWTATAKGEDEFAPSALHLSYQRRGWFAAERGSLAMPTLLAYLLAVTSVVPGFATGNALNTCRGAPRADVHNATCILG
jgi:hypothetical protein